MIDNQTGTRDILVILSTLQPHMIISTKLIVLINSAHELVVQ